MAAVSSRRVRRAAALTAMALMLSACSSGSQTASRDESTLSTADSIERDSEPAAPVDLSTLEGEFVVTSSNPRLVAATGNYEAASVSIEGDELKVRYAYPQEGAVGLARGEEGIVLNGTASVSCGSDECNWIHPGHSIPLSITSVGGPPFPVVSMDDGEPPDEGVCGSVSPGEEWVVDTVSDNSFSFVGSWTRGGGDDPDCYRVVFDVEMTRA